MHRPWLCRRRCHHCRLCRSLLPQTYAFEVSNQVWEGLVIVSKLPPSHLTVQPTFLCSTATVTIANSTPFAPAAVYGEMDLSAFLPLPSWSCHQEPVLLPLPIAVIAWHHPCCCHHCSCRRCHHPLANLPLVAVAVTFFVALAVARHPRHSCQCRAGAKLPTPSLPPPPSRCCTAATAPAATAATLPHT